MKRTMTSRLIFLFAAAGVTLHAAAAPVPDKTSLGTALARYLADRGQLCVGKYDWPITVTPQDAGMDWVDPALAKRSMELLATEVMPRVNRAIASSSDAK